jgi:hypothetical protein
MDERVPVPPDPRGQAFDWFVQNEQQQGGRYLRGISLPAADGDPLPIHPGRERGDRRGAERGR